MAEGLRDEPRLIREWQSPRLRGGAASASGPAPIEVLVDRLLSAARAARPAGPLVWLDPGGPALQGTEEGVVAAFPLERRTYDAERDGRMDTWLDALGEGQARVLHAGGPRFRGGWLGHLSYEAVEALESVRLVRRPDLGVPLAAFGRYPVWFRHLTGEGRLQLWSVLVGDPEEGPDGTPRPSLAAWVHWADEALRAPYDNTTPMHAFGHHLVPAATAGREGAEGLAAKATRSFTRDRFEAAVCAVQEAIREGEVFQANLAQRISLQTRVDPFHVYLRLRRLNPSPFAAYLESDWGALVSNSPERLVEVHDRSGARTVEARPIAGTRPRHGEAHADRAEVERLAASDKERAEHTMLVDLVRNDLGRVSLPGSVRVDAYQTVEAYSHVHHLVSNVRGSLRGDARVSDVVRALFPGGTITGAPKLRSVEVIDRVEPVGRGPYTGSVGHIGSDGTLDLNILIRTLVFAGGWVHAYAGAGIVADSDPASEYDETMHKAEAMLVALATVERADAARALANEVTP